MVSAFILIQTEVGRASNVTREINGVKVVCFQNRSDNPKAPKWKVLKSKPRDEQAPPTTKIPRQALDDSDIPF